MADEFVVDVRAGFTGGVLDSNAEIYLLLRIKDKDGQPVTGLKKTDFAVVQMGHDLEKRPIADGDIVDPRWGLLDGTYQFRVGGVLYGQLLFAVVVTSDPPTRSRPGQDPKGASAYGRGQGMAAVLRLE